MRDNDLGGKSRTSPSRVSLVRTFRFRASHHYSRPDWTPERNRAVFDEAVRSHEHEWTLTVWVAGRPDRAAPVLSGRMPGDGIRSSVRQ